MNEKNIGGKDLVAQWNRCLEYTNGEYIILASDDDIYSPLYLEKMDKLVHKYPEVKVFRPRVQYINENNKVIYSEKPLLEKMSMSQYVDAWLSTKIGSGIPFYVFNRAAIKECGGFANYPLGWFSDDATVIGLLENGMAYSCDILFSLRCSNINISSKKHSKQDILKKIEATEIFYYFMQDKIDSLPIINIDGLKRKQQLGKQLSYFLCETKLRSQIFNSSLVVVFSILPRLIQLEFMSNNLLFKYYISHLRSIILRKYQRL